MIRGRTIALTFALLMFLPGPGWADDLFQAIDAERESHRGQVFTKSRRQAIIAASTSDLEPKIANVCAK